MSQGAQVLQLFSNGADGYSSTSTDNRGLNNNNNKQRVVSSTSTVSRVHAYARGQEAPYLDELRSEYLYAIGRQMTRQAEEDCLYFVGQGVEPAVIQAVLQETAEAPQPSWRYACAIIYRLMHCNCMTLSAYDQDKAEFRARKEAKFKARMQVELQEKLGMI